VPYNCSPFHRPGPEGQRLGISKVWWFLQFSSVVIWYARRRVHKPALAKTCQSRWTSWFVYIESTFFSDAFFPSSSVAACLISFRCQTEPSHGHFSGAALVSKTEKFWSCLNIRLAKSNPISHFRAELIVLDKLISLKYRSSRCMASMYFGKIYNLWTDFNLPWCYIA